MRLFLFFLLFAFAFQSSIASPAKDSLTHRDFVIRSVAIEGNKRTKEPIIRREILFTVGDTMSGLLMDSLFLKSKQNVLNTSLFHSAEIDTISDGNFLDVKLTVHERWYTWPNPFFEIADRNFNVWWESRDFARTTYGMLFVQENFRGRNEKFYLLMKFQYTQQYGFGYSIPYLDKKKRVGMSVNASLSRWHEATYGTSLNKLLFIKDGDKYLRREWTAGISAVYRPRLYNSHTIAFDYKHNEVEDTVLALNPEYFFFKRNSEKYFRLSYRFRRDHRDLVSYPLKGYYFDVELVPTLVGIDYKPQTMFWALSTFKQFFKLAKNTYFAYSIKGKVSAGATQPYFNTRGLGYGNEFVRSYEYYVIDGQHYALFRSNLKYNLLPTKVVKLDQVNLSKFNSIPVAIYINLFSDWGYVWATKTAFHNTLPNTLVGGYGVGLDYVTYYSIVLRGEYSMNRMGEHGFAFHMALPI